ncbi:hypothetical protein [Nonlabens ulvanivorans]|uniref:hypothetical protein n=1 Tax=Nonlabens ulvanivorans TaxID=906888 RepID=UPI0029437F92|nr:hypothetical protein [Nonlabens ulvanivorans]WOI23233.1 hypothetical protein R1T42_02045 [Nonlabens ulvanivorans]
METFIYLTFLLTALAMIGFVVGMFFLIRWLVRKANKEKTPQQTQNEKQQLLARVDYMKKSLAPWGDRSFTDISSWMTYQFSKGMTRRLIGTVYATDQKPIMAFSRVERGFRSDGQFYVGSSIFNLGYEVKEDTIYITLNNQYLGSITNSGGLFDAQKKYIGNAVHPTKVSLSSGNFRYRFGDSSYEVIINEKRLATVYVAPNYADFHEGLFKNNFNENAIGQPIMSLLNTPSPEEEKWLLAIAVLEIVHHGHWMI